MPSHPYARSNGTVLEHRLVAEYKLGRYLKPEECVHHLDGNKRNNHEDNLIVFRSISDHARFHKTNIMIQMEDNTYISPTPESRIEKCVYCGKYFICDKLRKCFCSGECYSSYRKLDFNRKVESGRIPTIEHLIALIYNASFLEIGRLYGVSDNAVRKWCIKYGLPYKRKDLKNSELKQTLYSEIA